MEKIEVRIFKGESRRDCLMYTATVKDSEISFINLEDLATNLLDMLGKTGLAKTGNGYIDFKLLFIPTGIQEIEISKRASPRVAYIKPIRGLEDTEKEELLEYILQLTK